MALRELAHRTSDNGKLDVTLVWDDVNDRIGVLVSDGDVDFIVQPPKDKAMDAFHHPYAYGATEPRSSVLF